MAEVAEDFAVMQTYCPNACLSSMHFDLFTSRRRMA
jgi:hypothetical protein